MDENKNYIIQIVDLEEGKTQYISYISEKSFEITSNINEAIYKLYQKTEGSTIETEDLNLFHTCTKEMKSMESLIRLYNRFAMYSIDKIYIVTVEIYDEEEEIKKREAQERLSF